MRLICDEMLRGLARWLRAAGYDTATPEVGQDDGVVLARAQLEARILLTRDRDLWERTGGWEAVWLRGQSLEEWVVELERSLTIDWLAAPFSRCLLCNSPLESVAAPDVQQTIRRCPDCRKDYWEGSHTRRMRHQLRFFQTLKGGGR